MKKCKICKINKNESDYSPNKYSKDHLEYACKQCRAEKEQLRRISLGIKPKPKPKVANKKEKECIKCKKIKPLRNFPKNIRGRCGCGAYCKLCDKEFHKQLCDRPGYKKKSRKATQKYRDTNREYWRSLHRLNQFNRKSKIKAQSDGTVTNEFMQNLYSLTHCHWCKQFIPECNRTAEHIIPLAKGGIHGISNLTMACFSCNSSRKNF